MEPTYQFITPAIIFLLTLALGFRLSHAGQPYNGLLFNAHKLIALVGVVLAGLQFYKMFHTFVGLLIGLLVFLALYVFALFTSGALMSAGKLGHALVLVSSAAPTVGEFKSGSLYRARDGGYLAHLEYVVVVKPQSWTITMSNDYSTTEPSQVTSLYDRTYAPDGTLAVKVPEICVGQVK